MRLCGIARLLLAFCVVVSLGMSQPRAERPNFSGHWTRPNSSFDLTIIQDVSTITVMLPPGMAPGRKLVYLLDGSESHNTTTTVTGERWTHVSRATWVSAALVIITTTTRDEAGSWDWMTIYSFTSDTRRSLSVTTVDATLSSIDAMATDTQVYMRAQ